MRHRKAGRKLGRNSAHRKALFRNLAAALIRNEQIRTTDAKAKELRSIADRMVTLAKSGTLAARRRALDRLRSPTVVRKLFDEIGPRFQDRAGGYTRVTKVAPRRGDSAPLSVIEWTVGKDEETSSGSSAGRKARKTEQPSGRQKSPARKKAAAGA